MKYVLFLILFCSSTTLASDGRVCEQLFSSLSVHDRVYDLAELRIKIDTAKAANEDSLSLKSLNREVIKKEKELLNYLQESGMTRAQLTALIIAEVENIQEGKKKDLIESERVKNQEAEIAEATIDGTVMFFNTVEKGTFIRNPLYGPDNVNISKDFDMMATLVTEGLYSKILLAYFATGKGNRPIHFKSFNIIPNTQSAFPMTSLNYFEVQNWIEVLNTLSKEDHPLLYDVIRDFRKGDRFRLPYEAEWEFVATERGTKNENDIYGDGTLFPEWTRHIFWSSANAYIMQPVATMPAIVVSNHSFYDMIGNVRQWTADDFQKKPKGGTDPKASNWFRTGKVVRGISWATKLSPADRSKQVRARQQFDRWRQSAGENSNDIGFRLVREREP